MYQIFPGGGETEETWGEVIRGLCPHNSTLYSVHKTRGVMKRGRVEVQAYMASAHAPTQSATNRVDLYKTWLFSEGD